jgi:pyruvate/2-oxoglutarate dehydrogenase complex dihydrolipoamide dehydrogenase (E3) component
VIWGGSTGLTARKAATRIGTRVALVEKGPLGGTCVNHG